MKTIVTDSQGRQAEVIKEQGEQLQIRYFNNRTAFVHKSRVSMPATNTYLEGSDFKRLAVKIQQGYEAIEKMKAEAEKYSNDFARGATHGYRLALEVLDVILKGE
jgi:hypothetical protein